jgi:hypothetical protein
LLSSIYFIGAPQPLTLAAVGPKNKPAKALRDLEKVRFVSPRYNVFSTKSTDSYNVPED